MLNKSNPLISVIIPVYNTESYLSYSIDSIINQTYKKFELIIVNDGSTDNSFKILQSYKDKRIICLQNERNIGNYSSRNKGVKIARGKYIAIMDGDDIAYPNRLENQLEYLENNNDIIALGTNFTTIPYSIESDLFINSEEIKLSLLKGFYSLLHPSLMIRANNFIRMGGYNENYIYASDYDLICRLSFEGKIENLSDRLMIYRNHSLQISNNKRRDQLRYAFQIRKKYQINFINRYRHKNQALVTEMHVSFPQMGLIIAYYTYSVHQKDDKYKDLADELLNETIKLSETEPLPVCLDSGLCGLGCGLIYLVRNNFIDGDENDILEEFDNYILNYTMKQNEKDEYYNNCCSYLLYRFNNLNSNKCSCYC